MEFLKKFNDHKSINEKVGDTGNSGNTNDQLEHYQKLFDEAYAKKDKALCAKYDKILIDLYKDIL